MNKNPQIYLCDLTYVQQTISSDVMPAAIGSIGAFLQDQLPYSIDVSLFKYPSKLIEALEAIEPGEEPQIVGFSNYVWNSRLSLAFAQVIKQHFPNVIIIFGGPNLPIHLNEQEEFLRRNPVIDFHIVKEGELAFCLLVNSLIENDYKKESVSLSEVPNLVFIDETGQAQSSENVERVAMEELPSPYLLGMMDEFFDGKLLPIVQTNRGCPFSCSFCTEGMRYWTKVRRRNRDRVEDEIVYISRKMHDAGGDARTDLHIADSNFGMYPEDVKTAHKLADTRAEFNYPQYINVSTGKNQKERILEVARIVGGAMKLAGSVQSLDKTVLKNIKRSNINAEQLMELAMNAGDIGANSYSEVILALPGDTLEAHFETLRVLVEAGFNTVAMYQMMILPGTEMGSHESRVEFGLKGKYRLLPRCYGYFDVLGNKINVGEIEEICIHNKTLPFDDYLNGRRMNLIVNVFYNDGVFRDLLKFIGVLGLSVWEWLTIIYEEKTDCGDFKQLLDDFMAETANELWDSHEDLEVFCQDRDNIQKVIDGKLGGNLMFNYKGMSMTHCLEDVASVAEEAVHELLKRHGVDSSENLDFASEIVRFNYLKMTDLFCDSPVDTEESFMYDIGRFADDDSFKDVTAYHFAEPVTIFFEFDEEQKKNLSSYLSLFGSDRTGISRILSRIYIRTLFRNARLGSGIRLADESKTFLTGKASLTGLNEFE